MLYPHFCLFVFQGLTVHSKSIIANAKRLNYPFTELSQDKFILRAPDGYKFTVHEKDSAGHGETFDTDSCL